MLLINKLFEYINLHKYSIINIIIFSIFGFYLFSVSVAIHSRSTFLILSISNAIIVQSLIYLFSKNKILRFIFIPFLILVICIQISFTLLYSAPLNDQIIGSVFETNKTEAVYMLSTVTKYIPVFFIVFLILTFITIKSSKELRSYSIKVYKVILIICVCLVINFSRLFIFSRYWYPEQILLIKSDFRESPILASSNIITIWTPLFIRIMNQTIAFAYENIKIKSRVNITKKSPIGISINKNIDSPRVVFIVLGESSTRSHYSLYNYPISTTPQLENLNKEGSILYYKGLSPAPITRMAVPIILTFYTVHDSDHFYNYKNIIDLSKDLEYKSYWISNYPKLGAHDSAIGTIASQTDYQEFYNYSKDDLELIDEIDNWYSPVQKQIFIIHLKGSHGPYTKYYDDIDKFAIDNENFGEFLDYDRTIHHTDRVLHKIYENYFSKNIEKDKVLFYFPDHGEIVNIGHGLTLPDDKSSIEQYRVPFIVFADSSRLQKADITIKKYMYNDVLNTSNFPYIFSETIGYEVTPEEQKSQVEIGKYYRSPDRKINCFKNFD